ncbi:hypothetical protein LWI29_019895 [Acer saccharum]|uniref:Uncharacterized protein n=1 Tax=Acer saccharum TaxID=4024 RepID=A0AA39RIA0_ACESA|nr:hypothetical protein LWI29_019895 [Acer saccharum]
MKVVSDSEQVHPHATLGHRPDTKPFECGDNAPDSIGLKSENNMMDYQNGVLCASEAQKRDADGWTVKKLDRSVSLNDLTNNNEKDVRDLTEPYSRSCREIESFEDSGFYMEKTVMECELPELIVCYKESTYHVKDICVDEGVRSHDKNLFKSDVDDKGFCILPPPKKDRNSEPMEEKNKNDKPLPDVMKSSAENASDMDKICKDDSSPENVHYMCVLDLLDASKDFTPTGDDSTDKIANTVSPKLFSLADLLSMQNLVSENSRFECSSGKAVSGNPALISTTGESNDDIEEAIAASSNVVSAAEESNGGNEEAVLANPALVLAAEEKQNDSKEETLARSDVGSESEESTKNNIVEKLSYNSKVETGTITFDFDASAPTAKGTEDCPHHGESAPIESPDTSKNEDSPIKSVSSQAHSGVGESSFRVSGTEDAPRQSVSSQAHGGIGESSFSVLGSVPGLITYSGPVAFSGNLSVRSDSSTTSTRSFAFPVLQSEWNSSPVRMANADRRHQKHKCWRQGLLCCAVNEVQQLYVSTVQLPRKLRFTSEVTVNGHGETLHSHNKHKEEEVTPSSGKQYKEEEKVIHGNGNGSKGTRQEWVEGTDTSQYFTMDYSHVKRRRPIHNKSLPVAP